MDSNNTKLSDASNKQSIVKASASNIFMYVIVFCCIGFSIYNYNRLLRASNNFARKEFEWEQKYKTMEDRLQYSNDYAKDFNAKITESEKKYEITDGKIRQLELNIAQIHVLENADQLMAMQFKHILFMASEQLKITQDAQPALVTLQSILDKLAPFQGSKWTNVKQILLKDILNLKMQPSTEISGILDQINKNILLLNKVSFINLPVQSMQLKINDSSNTEIGLFKKISNAIADEVYSLIRIRKVNNPYAITLDQQEEWLVRAQINLFLNQAKLAVYNRNQNDFITYINEIKKYTELYIDNNDIQAQDFNKVIQNLGLIQFSQNLINIDNSLKAITEAS